MRLAASTWRRGMSILLAASDKFSSNWCTFVKRLARAVWADLSWKLLKFSMFRLICNRFIVKDRLACGKWTANGKKNIASIYVYWRNFSWTTKHCIMMLNHFYFTWWHWLIQTVAIRSATLARYVDAKIQKNPFISNSCQMPIQTDKFARRICNNFQSTITLLLLSTRNIERELHTHKPLFSHMKSATILSNYNCCCFYWEVVKITSTSSQIV